MNQNITIILLPFFFYLIQAKQRSEGNNNEETPVRQTLAISFADEYDQDTPTPNDIIGKLIRHIDNKFVDLSENLIANMIDNIKKKIRSELTLKK